MPKPLKLLIITQKLDERDSVLGFFVGWVRELAKHFPQIIVVCLEKGEYDLPANVRVLSLGKPAQGWSASGGEQYSYHSHVIRRLVSLSRFYKYIWEEKNNYDAVFVHMNQEYVLLAGKWWWFWGKPVGLWRNHHAGSWLTDLAVWLSNISFCTSRYSYTAKFKKNQLMPIGVDLDLFKPDLTVTKQPHSILFLGRLSPVKKQAMFIEALIKLDQAGEDFSATIVGDYLPWDKEYYDDLTRLVAKNNLGDKIKILPGVSHIETVKLYQTHEWAINLSSSGMYDKIIFEAMACGTPILATNQNLVGLIDERLVIGHCQGNTLESEPEGVTLTAEHLAERLRLLLNTDQQTKTDFIAQAKKLVEANSLSCLVIEIKHAYENLHHN
ncbi:MAG: hypothetical protein COV09_00215 [Candidatus Vogelbacteria bacterium CG10_big_fil_rev_8_21_14_0_10_50_13]|uniref:Glycosyl transferase family 1 domain-containing protein n=1 Tax=Candidatus Vogelbacteria bacterium CG10_big_fil_rev_8_21_14_0_10_50_13 TaxID=1975044 RepID=A0A2H0RGM4_9BACT|nr:MAG: hypothetical protein COV09_00215 [Candidatus Vogelbacteria bacterium CG10_big_fil_rev_8_21_14_0_10_50_13]